MSDRSAIEWTATAQPDGTVTPGSTWNPIRGTRGRHTCVKVSPGCQFCYAERQNKRFTGIGYEVGADTARLDEQALRAPLGWKAPRKIFVCSMTDLFGEWVPDEWIDRVFAIMALTPWHTYQCLTKRPARMLDYIAGARGRLSALLYNAMYEQRADDPFAALLRVGNRQRWAGLENSPSWRQPTTRRYQDHPGTAAPGGISSASGVSASSGDRREYPIRDGGSSPSLDPLQRDDPGGVRGQPQERTEGRQPAEQSGVNNGVAEPGSRARGPQGSPSQANWIGAPQNTPHRSRRDRDQAIAREWPNGQPDSREVRNEATRNFGDLQSEDLAAHLSWPLPNVWLGVTAENQQYANERIPLLLSTPAAVRFVSCEPLLGPIYLSQITRADWTLDALTGLEHYPGSLRRGIYPALDWVITGGESGGPVERMLVEKQYSSMPTTEFQRPSFWQARADRIPWVRAIRDQCQAAGIAYFHKQWGGPTPHSGGAILDDRLYREFPAVLHA